MDEELGGDKKKFEVKKIVHFPFLGMSAAGQGGDGEPYEARGIADQRNSRVPSGNIVKGGKTKAIGVFVQKRGIPLRKKGERKGGGDWSDYRWSGGRSEAIR